MTYYLKLIQKYLKMAWRRISQIIDRTSDDDPHDTQTYRDKKGVYHIVKSHHRWSRTKRLLLKIVIGLLIIAIVCLALEIIFEVILPILTILILGYVLLILYRKVTSRR